MIKPASSVYKSSSDLTEPHGVLHMSYSNGFSNKVLPKLPVNGSHSKVTHKARFMSQKKKGKKRKWQKWERESKRERNLKRKRYKNSQKQMDRLAAEEASSSSAHLPMCVVVCGPMSEGQELAYRQQDVGVSHGRHKEL